MNQHKFNIVLYSPEIPGNTGSIGRTCLALGARLILIKPYGFDLTEKAVRRAGLDYWKYVDLVEYEKEAAVKERRYLMDALAKIKVERDYLEDILVTCEDENTRLSSILNSTRAELAEVKARKWWHSFVPKSFLKKG